MSDTGPIRRTFIDLENAPEAARQLLGSVKPIGSADDAGLFTVALLLDMSKVQGQQTQALDRIATALESIAAGLEVLALRIEEEPEPDEAAPKEEPKAERPRRTRKKGS